MTAVGPGDTLRCVDNYRSRAPECPAAWDVTIGSIYRCKGVLTSIERCPHDDCGFVAITVEGKDEQCPHCGDRHEILFCPNFFVPVDGGFHCEEIEQEKPLDVKAPELEDA